VTGLAPRFPELHVNYVVVPTDELKARLVAAPSLLYFGERNVRAEARTYPRSKDKSEMQILRCAQNDKSKNAVGVHSKMQ